MEERRVADYFVVAGLPENPVEIGEFNQEGTCLKPTHSLPPITDVTVIFHSLGESVPPGYTCITLTPSGHSANLTSGAWMKSSEVYLCYKRGLDKPPLVDIGVIYDGKERIMSDSQVVRNTPENRPASITSGTSTKTYVTFRRAPERMPCNQLVVTDVCVINPSKGEFPPHAFCLIDKSLNKNFNFMGMSGAYICYKKSMHRPNLITYKSAILARYPRTDHAYFPFPENVPMFCLPMGATVECWPAEAAQPKPLFSTFVLTVADGTEMIYGSAISFYERVPDDNLTPNQRKLLKLDDSNTLRNVNTNKCICLLSHWPFFDTFEKFLKFLYKMTCNGPHAVPVERYISYFLENVPFPSPKRPRILFQLSSSERIILTQPEDLPLPKSGAGFCALLSNLGPDNCLLVLLLALTEQKILVHSLRPDVLTAVAEAISMIIFPFKWQCPYIPLCPLSLAYVLHAPLPFLIGVDSRFFDLFDPPPEISYIDLDTNSITINQSGDDKEKTPLTYKLLPKKAARNLLKSLQRLFSKVRITAQNIQQSVSTDDFDDASIDWDFIKKRKEQALEVEIQEAFLHFMATVLKGYRSFLLPITKAPTAGTTDPSSLFDLEGFKRSRDRAHHKFFELTMKTQMFIKFIEERSFVSNMDASLAFFDDCAERVGTSDDNDAPLLELDDPQKSENTVFIMPPEPTGLPSGATYSYRGFVLNPLLFNQNETEKFLGVPMKENLFSILPGSPVAKRTKHEIRSAQKTARKSSASPLHWAKCLLSTCYSLWFIHLPSHVLQSQSKAQGLQKAFDLLEKLHKLKVQPSDEVCYRVVMQLCGLYNMPVLAVKLLFLMKRSGMQPNAITYGFYNRAVLEAAWPSDITNSSQLLWAKLRNVILGVALFRRAGRKVSRRRLSMDKDSDGHSLGGVSRTSVESGNSSHDSAPVRNSKEVVEVATQQKSATLGSDAGYGSLYESTSRGCLSECNTASDAEKVEEEPLVNKVEEPLDESDDLNSEVELRPRVSSIVKAPTPVSLNPQHPESSGLSENHVELRRPVSVGTTNDNAYRRRHFSGSDFSRARDHRSVSANETNDCFQMLRSESFANDAQILEKLGQLKVIMQNEEKKAKKASEVANGIKRRGKLGSDTVRSESQDLEQAVMDYMQEGDEDPSCATPPRHAEPSTPPNYSRTPRSPARTIVTENDPLGALNVDEEDEEDAKVLPPSVEQSPAKSWIAEEGSGGPLLFKDSTRSQRRKTEDISDKFTPPPVLRSATYHQGLGVDGISKSQTPPESCVDSDDIYMDDGQRKVIQRSSTLPASPSSMAMRTGVAASPSVASSLSSLGSSFKLPFRRYSPGRLSLRKPDLRLLENAQNALTQHFSPGSLTGKRTNEMIMNLRSAASTAATSMAKKFDEIKEVISSNSTPVKGTTPYGHLPSSTRESSVVEDEEDGRSRNTSYIPEFSPLGSMGQYAAVDYWGSNLLDLFGGGDSSRKGSATNLNPSDTGSNLSLHTMLPEKIYQRKEEAGNSAIAVEIEMTSCSKCHNCLSIMYDEEIMAGWVPDDSNLNTKCQHCDKPVVPFLVVRILDFREMPVKESSASPLPACSSSQSLQELACSKDLLHPDSAVTGNDKGSRTRSRSESQLADKATPGEPTEDLKPASECGMDPVAVEPVTVPYLNPLVLRKEIESILDNEGDAALNKSNFVDEHPIIYWNLVWVFQRIDVESHLPSLCLESSTVSKGRVIHCSWNEVPKPGILIRCLWENPRFYEDVGRPMYIAWQQMRQLKKLSLLKTDLCAATMEKIISCVKSNDLLEPMNKVAAERHALKPRSYSIYRDILFLAFAALDRDNIDQVAFDEEYRIAYDKLSHKELKLYLPCDQPLTNYSVCCRHFFRELEL
ncbi:C-myc promoter-binding protein isoform X2 [Neocloeon triangulifer]|uniref:C-myc promoter-binding protein isoform X2 n=1 Tax=Neocloeon triangulifer TaxID=2078957 RepID=UPI00286FA59E|nr:C-myc promoter-binding protein isoform X2 [Neocloeon triangulifer]